jgi:hypothetical protein
VVKLLAFLLCERATFNRDEKASLHGLFDGLRLSRPKSGPLPPFGRPAGGPYERVFFVFYKIVTDGQCTISLRIIKPSGEEIEGDWVDSVMLWAAGALIWQSIWGSSTNLFQESGSYTLELLVQWELQRNGWTNTTSCGARLAMSRALGDSDN